MTIVLHYNSASQIANFSILIHIGESIYDMRRRKRSIEYNDVQFHT